MRIGRAAEILILRVTHREYCCACCWSKTELGVFDAKQGVSIQPREDDCPESATYGLYTIAAAMVDVRPVYSSQSSQYPLFRRLLVLHFRHTAIGVCIAASCKYCATKRRALVQPEREKKLIRGKRPEIVQGNFLPD